MLTISCVSSISSAYCGVDYKRTDNKQVVVYLDNNHGERLFTSDKNVATLELINSSEKKRETMTYYN